MGKKLREVQTGEVVDVNNESAHLKALQKTQQSLSKKSSIKKGLSIAAIALTAGAIVVAPAVIVYKKKNSEYEVSVVSEATGFESLELSIKRGSTIKDLKGQVNTLLPGHVFAGIYKDRECTEPYLDSDKITSNSTVFFKFEKIEYKVTFPTTQYYDIEIVHLEDTKEDDDITTVYWGDSFSFRVNATSLYSQNFTVKVNGVVLEPNNHGTYQVNFVQNDIAIDVVLESLATVTMFSNINGSSSFITVNWGTTIGSIKSDLTEIAGWSFEGIYKDANYNQPFQDSETIEGNTIIYLKYTQIMYSITLPESLYYSFNYPTSIDINNFAYGESFSFQIEHAGDYNGNFYIYANGELVTQDQNGYYTIHNLQTSVDVEVELDRYTISEIPSQVTITDEFGNSIATGGSVEYGTLLTASFVESEGMVNETFEVNGVAINNNEELIVKTDLNITYTEVAACGLGFTARFDGSAYIATSYDGSVADVVIPSKVYNKPVTGTSAGVYTGGVNGAPLVDWSNALFYKHKDAVRSLYIPGTIKTVSSITGDQDDNNGFLMSNLISLEIGDGVEYISGHCFANVSALKRLVLPNSIKRLDFGNFLSSNLNYLEIGADALINNKSNIENFASYGNTYSGSRIEVIKVNNPENKTISLSGYDWYNGDVDYLLSQYYSDHYVRDSIVEYENVVYYKAEATWYQGNNKVELTEPYYIALHMIDYKASNVKLIHGIQSTNGCFADNPYITSVELEDCECEDGYHTPIMPGRAFEGCENLTTIKLPKNTKIGGYAFDGCTNLTGEISVGDVGDLSFNGTAITKVTANNVGLGAFQNCKQLQEVVVGSVGDSAFDRCKSLTKVTVNGSAIEAMAFSGCSALTEVILGENVQYINEYAFSNCTSLTSIIIPESVTRLGDYSFEGCTALTSVTIESAEAYAALNENSTLIANATEIKVLKTLQENAYIAENYPKRSISGGYYIYTKV